MSDIRWLITNSKEPLLFKNFLHWELLKWNLDKWSSIIGDEEMCFRCGKLQKTDDPQWERTTRSFKGKFSDLQNYQEKNPNEWIYFDYKYLREIFINKSQLHSSISWDAFGYNELKSEDSTIWIGSKGAHTPCHIDTYGCNLIAQIYGRKQWLIFPPEENLFPTRIPYEESSIYSKLNLFSPDIEKCKGISKCKSVILNPGEVLLLPHGWWHYVENLDQAISINVWLPLPIDNEKRLEESLVQFFISQIVRNLNPAERNAILNPNIDNQNLHTTNFKELIHTISTCKYRCINNVEKQNKSDNTYQNTENVNTETIIEHYKDKIKRIPYLSQDEFIKLLDKQKSRFDGNLTATDNQEPNLTSKTMMDIINAFMHQDVINLIKDKLSK